MINFWSVFFGKISDRDVALDMARWAGLSFYCVASLFVVWSLFAIPYVVVVVIFLFAALIYGACGYLTASKLSRAAVIVGTFMAIPCFMFSSLFPGDRAFPYALAFWFGIRGIEATFKLYGRFYTALPPRKMGSE